MISDRQKAKRHIHIGAIRNVIKTRWVFTTLLTGFLFILSCRQSSSINPEGLYGKWDIVQAVRNGKETPYLRGGYFIIEPNGSMTVNITGSDEKGPYTLKDNTLSINHEKDFIIESLQNDSMAIRYIMNANSTFLFYLNKSVNETH